MHLHVWRPIWWIKNSVLCINAFLWYVFFFSKTGHYSQKVPSLESQKSIVCNIIQFLYTVAQLNVHLGQIKVKSLLTFLKKTIKGFQLSSTHFHPPRLLFTLNYDRNLFARPFCIDMQMHNIHVQVCTICFHVG